MAINRIGYPTFVPYTILDARYLKLDGSNSLSVNVLHFANYDLTMTGNASLQGTNTGDITLGTNTANALLLSGQVLGLDDKFVQWAGDTMTGNLTFSNASILEPNYIDFNTSYNTALSEGQLGYNATENGLLLGLAGGNVQVNLGKELVLPKRVRNSSGTTMTKGTVVYISGVSGNTPVVSRAIATSDATSAFTIGLTAEDIDDGSTGWVMFTGELSGLNLAAYNAGDTVYLSGTTAGQFTNVVPSAPIHYVRIGIVTKATASGELLVNIINGFELQELHNVAINQGTLANNDVIAYNSSTLLWENKQPNAILTKGNLTESTSSVLTITGGTGAVLGSGTTIQVLQASGSQSGFLSSTDWTTFNNKQDTVSVSDTSSVDLTFTSNTLSATVLPAGVDHNSLANLTTGDPHTQYALLAGRSGGQTLNGGTAASNNLTLVSTSNATKGKILFGTSAYDEVNNRLGIGFDAPLTTIHARSSAITAIRSETTATNNYAQFDLVSSTRRYSMGIGGSTVSDGVADDWYLYDANALAYRLVVDSSGRFGIGTTSPRGPLDVVASAPSVFQRDNAAVSAIHSYYNANTTNSNGINWTFYSDTTGAGASTLQIFGQWDLRFDQHDHATRSSSALFRNYVAGASNIWLWAGSNGNVGISTSSQPTKSLALGNATDRTFGIENSGASTVGRQLSIDAGNSGSGTDLAGGTLRLNSGNGTGTGASNITFFTGGVLTSGTTAQTSAERMRITNQGYVGIANTNPQHRLDIGNASFAVETLRLLAVSGGDSRLKLMEASDNYGFTLDYDGGTDTFSIIRHNNDATGVSALSIGRATGDVTLASKIIIPSGAVGAPSFTWSGDTTTGFFSETDGAFSFTSNGVQKMVFGPSSLQVNFATLISSYVRVNGAYNESTSDYGVYLGSSDSTNARILFCNGTSGQNWQIDNDGSGNFRWYTPGYNMMRLTKLGVLGTSRPQVDFYYNNTPYLTIDEGGLTFGNRASQTLEWVATAAGTGGRDLIIKAGLTTAGTANISGGTLYLDGGLGTGSGASNIVFRTGSPNATTTAIQTLDEEMRLTSLGYLGLGTNNPTSQLHVVGTRSATSGDYTHTLFDFTQSATSASLFTVYAYRAIARATHTSGTLQGLQSNSTQAFFTGNGGTTNFAEILTSYAEVGTGHTVSNLSMVKIYTPAKTGTITNLRGLLIENMTGGSSTNYSIYTEGGTQYFTGPTTQVGDLTISAADIITDTTTGTKVATATTQKLAFHGSTPVAQRASANQAAVATTGATNTTPYGYTTAAQANAIVTLVNELRAALVEKGIIKGSA